MKEIIFYNSTRIPIMNWSNFILDRNKEGVLYLNMKVKKSIFIVDTICEIYLRDLLALKKNIELLYQQRIHKVLYTSFDELLNIELEWKEYGHIKQTFVIKEGQTNSSLEIVDYFDQSFLPELVNSMDSVLIEINNWNYE